MSVSAGSSSLKTPVSWSAALGVVLALWLSYTLLYTLNPGDLLTAFLELLPGLLAVGVLLAAGLRLKDCYLRLAPLSRTGFLLLTGLSLFLPFILMTGRWTGWNGMAALVFAPAGALSQELFFRAALLPALIRALKDRTLPAVAVQAALFMVWHMPKALMTAPLPGVMGVVLVTFIGGLLWGWQVQRDQTVVWAIAHHSLLLMIQSLFTWG